VVSLVNIHGSQCRRLTAVDVQRLAGDKTRVFEVEDPVDDVADLTHPPDGLNGGQEIPGT
jgi:hypothetical protein